MATTADGTDNQARDVETGDNGHPIVDQSVVKGVLRVNALFRGLPESVLTQVAAATTRRVYPKGAILFAQGDPGDALFIVAAGKVRVSATGASGREIFLNIMEPGDTLGEIAVIDGRSRTAGAFALEDTTLVILKRSDFLPLLQLQPRLALHLLDLLCQRLRWTSELVEESTLKSASARLARRLLTLASLHGRPASGRGSGSALELRISQADLARFLGGSRQAVNQQLGEWAKSGWVALTRGRIIITDPDHLQRIAEAVSP